MPTNHDPPDLIPIGEAARILFVSVETVRRWTADGLIPVTRTLKGHRRYRRTDIEALVSDPRGKVAS